MLVAGAHIGDFIAVGEAYAGHIGPINIVSGRINDIVPGQNNPLISSGGADMLRCQRCAPTINRRLAGAYIHDIGPHRGDQCGQFHASDIVIARQ